MTPRLHPSQIQNLLVEAQNLFAQGRLAEAETACRRVLDTAPNNPLATHYLGAIAFSFNHFEPALKLLRRATELDPSVAAYFSTYAEALAKRGQFEEALVAMRSAAKLKPGNAEFLYRLGALAGKLGSVDESITALQQAAKLVPNASGVHNDLGITLTAARRMPEALASFERAIQIDPNYRTAYDNLVYYSHFAANIDGAVIRQRAENAAAHFAEPLKSKIAPHANDHSPDRRLRIGFVSPDLWIHPVGRFLFPVLEHHDREAYEIVCYNDSHKSDAVTDILRRLSAGWHDTIDMSDDDLARLVREDRIDILIDHSLHMGGNCLMLFARKPAPVQVTYLGYPGTSGMSAIDWRISDEQLDPPGNDRFYTERTHRLPHGYWCYAEPILPEEIGELKPRDAAAPIRFACLNNTVKISDEALEAWAKILQAIPDSTILIQAEPGKHLEVMRGYFERAGVNPTRIQFAEKKDLLGYFALYHRVDIALDSFPYAGGTTTCDALWMGVPVITLAGQIAVHRGGVSILTNVGLTEFISTSIDQYVAAAIALANNPAHLMQLRNNLRDLMKSSSLMQPKAFTIDLQNAWRSMWKDWANA